MGSFPGSSEIVEAEDEPSSSRHAKGMYHQSSGLSVRDKDLKLGYKDSLEDDINKLFEAINLKTSKGLGLSQQAGSSPLNKHASKRPIIMGMPRSPGAGSSEPATLKQALRELSLTKASEMAAMKRLSKMTASNGPSEAGRIKTLYNEVVLEARKSGPVFVEGRGNMVEISLVSEESTSNALEKMPVNLQTSRMKSPNESANSSPRFAAKQNVVGTTMVPNENVSTTKKAGSQPIKSKLSQQERTTLEPSPSRSDHGSDSLGFVDVPVATKSISVANPTRNESASTSGKAGVQTIKAVLLEKEQHTTEPSPSTSCHGGKTSKLVENVPESTKLRNKPSAQRAQQKVRLHGVSSSSSSAGGNKVSKLSRTNPRLMKSASRNRNLAKKKLKQDLSSAAFSSGGFDKGDAKLDPNTGQLVCERCHCTLKNSSKKPSQASSGLPPKSEGNSTYGHSNANKPGVASESRAKSGATSTKAKKNTKSREKGEFSQSSQGEYSSSTTMSDESNLSGSSCGNRPHMSKDVRWEAIRQVWMQDGVLSLDHFNLLKKLGCGDIGTVYLAELIATNCLFAIKVMDNEFLARRKKMPRAQTEREILKMLDHPFLPTLFSQFTSDNLSCLVMEYCPGGDLHVLRQKQPGRNYSESAARFYVAEVLLALEYLHMLGVVYRDLKPENVLVREDGHIMLTDFDLSLRCTVSPTLLQSSSSDVEPVRRSGPCTESSCVEPFCIEPSCRVPCFSPRILPTTAKTRKNKSDQAALIRNSLPQLVAEPTDARSNSFVGTHEYLAPEIIKGDGHGAAVDWWTFGIFLYELLYGRTPFKGANNEETLANVVLQTLKFPDTPIVSFQARDLIRGLLVKEPECRFGTEKGAAEIKQHPFFEGLNWALIRCAIPPEVPEFCEFDVPTSVASQEKETKYLECKATGELLEFELF